MLKAKSFHFSFLFCLLCLFAFSKEHQAVFLAHVLEAYLKKLLNLLRRRCHSDRELVAYLYIVKLEQVQECHDQVTAQSCYNVLEILAQLLFSDTLAFLLPPAPE
jgi:hypothetical protein